MTALQLTDNQIKTYVEKTVISIPEINGVKHNLIRNSSDAATVRVLGGSVTDVVNDENSIEITVNVEIFETTQWVKTRRFATKFTTVPYEVEFVGVDNAWDIVLNNECTKGHGALLEMFANASGVDHALHTAEGKLISANGDEINLYDENNAVHNWVDANRMEDVKIRMSIAKSTFDALVKAGNAEEGRSFFDTVEVISEGEDFDGNRFVVVEETIDVIFGQLVFDVEISTALESVSRSNLTLESATGTRATASWPARHPGCGNPYLCLRAGDADLPALQPRLLASGQPFLRKPLDESTLLSLLEDTAQGREWAHNG